MIKITVPDKTPHRSEKCMPIDVSTSLLSDDVMFVDENGNEVNVNYLGLFAGTDGVVKSRMVGFSNATSLLLASGGWHTHPVSYIYKNGTDASIAIFVRVSSHV